jgi:hypothetical protein
MAVQEVILTHLKYSDWIDCLPGGIQTVLVVRDFFLRDFALTRHEILDHSYSLSNKFHFSAGWHRPSIDIESMDHNLYISLVILFIVLRGLVHSSLSERDKISLLDCFLPPPTHTVVVCL